MDVLSETLRVIRLSGVVHFSAEFTRPWAILSTAPEMLAGRVVPGAELITPFHLVVAGSCWVQCGVLPPLRLENGDVILWPQCDQHVMASDLDVRPVPIHEIYLNPSAERTQHVTHGGGGAVARFICGYCHSDQRFNPLLEALPRIICVRQREGAVRLETVGEDGVADGQEISGPAAHWWENTLRYLASEATMPGPGNTAVLGRLTELLFLQVLRWYMQHLTGGQRGWLAGLNDPQVGRALRLLHAEPARPWTVETLARAAAISRAALARRFVDLVGESPMHYLAGWRMHLAKRLLRDSRLGIGEIAARVGYESEPAFNRAFRRLVGSPPAAWRRTGGAYPAGMDGHRTASPMIPDLEAAAQPHNAGSGGYSRLPS